MSRAAEALGTSQPAVSQQIRMLEEELGVALFRRTRNRLTGLTSQGETALESARLALAEIAKLQTVSQGRTGSSLATLRVASTHAQARYALPDALRAFRGRYPAIQVQIVYKHDEELWQLVQNGEVDLAVTTDTKDLPRSLLEIPCYPMKRIVIAPRGHPLLRVRRLTMEAIAEYPLVTYDERSSGRRRLMRAFSVLGYTPRIAVSAADEDVIKACVETGLGIAIVASIVFDRKRDIRLGAVDVTPLLEPSTTSVVLRRNMVGHSHVADFIRAFAPAWSAAKLERHASAVVHDAPTP